jgi:hypothetical protein
MSLSWYDALKFPDAAIKAALTAFLKVVAVIMQG